MPVPLAARTVRAAALAFFACVLAGMQVAALAQAAPPDGAPDITQGAQSSGPQGHRPPHPPSPAMELDHLTKVMATAEVPLSDAQKVSILGILEDREAARQTLQSSSTDRSATMQQTQALDKASRSAVMAVLTAAQQKVYATLRQGPGPGSGTPPSTGAAPPESGGAPPDPGKDDQADNLIDANTGGGIRQAAQ